jgi:hypothetical protein
VNLTSTREIAETRPHVVARRPLSGVLSKTKDISRAYEIDVYDIVMREVKHITKGTPQDKGNSKSRSGRKMESTSFIRRSRPRGQIRTSLLPM